MINEFLNRIINSEIMQKIRKGINNFIDTLALSNVKERIDKFVDNSESSEESSDAFNGLNKKVSKFINKKLKGRIRFPKPIVKIISILLSLGFGALVVYMMIKLLPKIVMMMSMVFAIWISIELIISILNTATGGKAA